MKVARASVSSVAGQMPVPSANARHVWRERRGLVLRLWDDEGRVGTGESSPLPGFSPESLESARAAFGVEPWQDFELDLSTPVLPQVRHLVARVDEAVPSARFALETALLDLVGQRLGRPLWALLSEEGTARPTQVAALIDAGEPDPIGAAQLAVRAGHRTIKIKIGLRLEQELKLLAGIRAELGSEVKIRLDANRALAGPHLADRLALIARMEPELVEEPAPPEAIEALGDVGVSLAFDESLMEDVEATFRWVGEGGPWRYVVLKPSVLGGLLRCAELARWCRARGAIPIVSHTLEGPVAFAAISALAVSLPGPSVTAGLGPHPGLDAWSKERPPMLQGATVVPWEEPGLGFPRASEADER